MVSWPPWRLAPRWGLGARFWKMAMASERSAPPGWGTFFAWDITPLLPLVRALASGQDWHNLILVNQLASAFMTRRALPKRQSVQ